MTSWFPNPDALLCGHKHQFILHRHRPRDHDQSIDDQAKFDALEEYRTSRVFTDAQRAALDYVTELTKNRTVNPDTFSRLTRYYSKREICEIVWLVASERFYNMTKIGLNIHPFRHALGHH